MESGLVDMVIMVMGMAMDTGMVTEMVTMAMVTGTEDTPRSTASVTTLPNIITGTQPMVTDKAMGHHTLTVTPTPQLQLPVTGGNL